MPLAAGYTFGLFGKLALITAAVPYSWGEVSGLTARRPAPSRARASPTPGPSFRSISRATRRWACKSMRRPPGESSWKRA